MVNFYLLIPSTDTMKDIIDILQGLVIIGATIFTVKWTHKTFAYKERVSELKEFKKIINLYHFKIQMFCAQVRNNEIPDKNEIKEKVELAGIHNKLVELHDLSFYVRASVRKKIIKIVGNWIVNDRLNKMQHRSWASLSEKERKEIWKKFDDEYNEVRGIIDGEVAKYSS